MLLPQSLLPSRYRCCSLQLQPVPASVWMHSFRALGAKQNDEANKIASNAAFLYIISYIVFLILGFTVVKPFYASRLEMQMLRSWKWESIIWALLWSSLWDCWHRFALNDCSLPPEERFSVWLPSCVVRSRISFLTRSWSLVWSAS